MNKRMLDIFIHTYESKFDTGKKRAVALLKDELLEKGTRVMLEGVEIYTKYLEFNDGGDCMFADSYDKPYDEVDFSGLEEKDIWALIYGDFIIRNRISEVEGFGVTKVNTSL
jgi:hypothetical protein